MKILHAEKHYYSSSARATGGNLTEQHPLQCKRSNKSLVKREVVMAKSVFDKLTVKCNQLQHDNSNVSDYFLPLFIVFKHLVRVPKLVLIC
jgi:hypothetical protein